MRTLLIRILIEMRLSYVCKSENEVEYSDSDESIEMELSDNKNENICNVCRSRKRLCILSNSEKESDVEIFV